MVSLNKYLLILLIIYGIISVYPHRAVGSITNGDQGGYIVKFGDSYRNYKKDNHVRIDVLFRNLTDKSIDVAQELIVLNANGKRVWKTQINIQLKTYQEFRVPFLVPVPQLPGNYTLTIPGDSINSADQPPIFKFSVIEPHKAPRLSKIMVLAPDWEVELLAFVTSWGIKAPSISWGQVVICGKKTWQRIIDGDKDANQLIERALRRDMSVIFLDFGPVEVKEGIEIKAKLPYDVKVKFIKASAPEISFIPERSIKALNYDLLKDNFYSLNGINGISVPPVDMRFEGKDVEITTYASSGKKPFRTPVVELKSKNDKGKLILCQVISDGRLDDKIKPSRNKPELPAYDPLAVQFILNLISASVGDELLK
jgi:hypothetical protein